MTNESPYRYFAFISYSHKDSGAAAWLQKKLGWFRFPLNSPNKPPHPRYVRPLFRDKTNLEFNSAHYLENIKPALKQSQFLIVVCSPNAAQSEPVEEEVKCFLGSRPDAFQYVVPVILRGNVNSGDASECLCPSLRALGSTIRDRNIPTMVPDGGDPEEKGWTNGFVGVAARLLNVQREAIERQYEKEEERRKRRRLWIIIALAALGAIALLAGGWGLKSHWQAMRTESWSDARRAEKLLAEGGAHEAVACLARAVETCPDNWQAAHRLVSLFMQRDWGTRVSSKFPHPDRVRDVAWDATGSRMITACQDHKVRIWNLDEGRLEGEPLEQPGVALSVALDAGGSRLIVSHADKEDSARGATVWDLETRRPIAVLPLPGHVVRCAGISPDGRWAVTLSSPPEEPNSQELLTWEIASRQRKGDPIRIGTLSYLLDRRPFSFTADSRHIAVADDLRWKGGGAIGDLSDRGQPSRYDLPPIASSAAPLVGRVQTPEGVQVSPGGGFAYVQDYPADRLYFWDVATARPRGWGETLAGSEARAATEADRLMMASDPSGTAFAVAKGRAIALYAPTVNGFADRFAGELPVTSLEFDDFGVCLLVSHPGGLRRLLDPLRQCAVANEGFLTISKEQASPCFVSPGGRFVAQTGAPFEVYDLRSTRALPLRWYSSDKWIARGFVQFGYLGHRLLSTDSIRDQDWGRVDECPTLDRYKANSVREEDLGEDARGAVAFSPDFSAKLVPEGTPQHSYLVKSTDTDATLGKIGIGAKVALSRSDFTQGLGSASLSNGAGRVAARDSESMVEVWGRDENGRYGTVFSGRCPVDNLRRIQLSPSGRYLVALGPASSQLLDLDKGLWQKVGDVEGATADMLPGDMLCGDIPSLFLHDESAVLYFRSPRIEIAQIGGKGDPRNRSYRHVGGDFRAWSVHPARHWVALGDSSGQITLLDTDTGNALAVYSPGLGEIHDLRWASDGVRLALIAGNGKALVCDPIAGIALTDPVLHEGANAIRISSDGLYLTSTRMEDAAFRMRRDLDAKPLSCLIQTTALPPLPCSPLSGRDAAHLAGMARRIAGGGITSRGFELNAPSAPPEGEPSAGVQGLRVWLGDYGRARTTAPQSTATRSDYRKYCIPVIVQYGPLNKSSYEEAQACFPGDPEFMLVRAGALVAGAASRFSGNEARSLDEMMLLASVADQRAMLAAWMLGIVRRKESEIPEYRTVLEKLSAGLVDYNRKRTAAEAGAPGEYARGATLVAKGDLAGALDAFCAAAQDRACYSEAVLAVAALIETGIHGDERGRWLFDYVARMDPLAARSFAQFQPAQLRPALETLKKQWEERNGRDPNRDSLPVADRGTPVGPAVPAASGAGKLKIVSIKGDLAPRAEITELSDTEFSIRYDVSEPGGFAGAVIDFAHAGGARDFSGLDEIVFNMKADADVPAEQHSVRLGIWDEDDNAADFWVKGLRTDYQRRAVPISAITKFFPAVQLKRISHVTFTFESDEVKPRKGRLVIDAAGLPVPGVTTK